MEDPLKQRVGKKRSPTESLDASAEVKQEPLDDDLEEPKVEVLQVESTWDCNINDPLKDEMEIGETSLTVQDPFFMIQELGMKTELKAEENEEIEDYGDFVDSSTKKRKLSDEAKSKANSDSEKDPLILEYSSTEELSCSDVESWILQDMAEPKVYNYIPPGCSSSTIARYGVASTATATFARSQVIPPSFVESVNYARVPPSKFPPVVALPATPLKCYSPHTEPLREFVATTVLSFSPVQRSEDLPADRMIKRLNSSDPTDNESTTKITPVKSKEELDTLENFLSTESNMQDMVERLSSLLTSDDAANRFCEALYIVVYDKFLIQCSWSGGGHDGPKIAFNRYVNLQKLLRIVADEGVNSLESADYEKILRSKLKHAKNKLHSKDMRKGYCRYKKRNAIISNVHKTSSTGLFQEMTPVKSMEELDRLEEFLNAESNIQDMARRLSSLMTSRDAANRFCEALYIVVYDKFLIQCSWLGGGKDGPKIAFHRYVNLQKLLQIVADEGVNSLERIDYEKILRTRLKNAKNSLRSKDVRKEYCRYEKRNTCLDPFFDIVSFTEIIPVTSREELKRLEVFLNTESNMQNMVEYLNSLISAQDADNRLSEALHMVMGIEFLAQCSWMGRIKDRPMIGLKKCVNIQYLLLIVTENGVHNLEKTEFEKLIKSNIFNIEGRLRCANIRESICRSIHMEIIPITSKEELDKLEEFLNTENNMQNMVKHLNSIITVRDAANRFCETLYILVCGKFLTQCSWMGGGKDGPKVAVRRYVKLQNVLRLVANAGVNGLERKDFERILRLKIKNAKDRSRFGTIRTSFCKVKICNSNTRTVHETNSSNAVFHTAATIEISPVTSKEELDKLEEFLNTESNMQDMVRRLSSLLTSDDAANRFCEALYIVVYDKFLIQCSWRGGGQDGPKIAFIQYVKLQKLLRIVADEGVNSLEKADYEKILRSKLKNAKNRLRNKDVRKGYCRYKKRNAIISNVHKSSSSDAVIDTGPFTEITPVKSKEELNRLEELLNTESDMQDMARRLSSLMTSGDAANRFCEALYIVVYDKFLIQCSWSGGGQGGPKIAFNRYVNLQKLLRIVADEGVNSLESADYEKILRSKLKHAKNKLRSKDMRKGYCRYKKRNANMSNVHKTSSSDAVIDTSPFTEIISVKSKEELDRLEEFLSNEINMQNTAKRMNRLMSTHGAVNRFGEALQIVISDDLLAQSNWLGGAKRLSRIGLQKYINFQSLLRLLAEDSVHSLTKTALEKMFKMKISDAKRRLRCKQTGRA